MTNEPIFNVASFHSRQKICTGQAAIETRLLPPAGISIAKVLSFSATPDLNLSDIFTGEARYGGRVRFSALFLDTAGGIQTLETAAEFNDKVLSDHLTAASKPDFLAKVLDIEVVAIASDEIKLACMIECDLFDTVAVRAKYLSQAGEDVFVQEETVLTHKLSTKSVETFDLSDEIKVTGNRLLIANPKIVLKGVSCASGFVTINGEVITDLLTEINGEILSIKATSRFSQQLSADGCTGDHHASVFLKLKKSQINLISDADVAAVTLDFEIEASTTVFEGQELTLAADAFSISSSLKIEHEQIEIVKNDTFKSATEWVEGSVTIDDDLPLPDRILGAVSDRLNFVNSFVKDGRLVIEGTVTASIVYYSAEVEGKNSVDIELPFSIVTGESVSGEVVELSGCVYEMGAKLRRSGEIDIRAEIAFCVGAASRAGAKVITGLTRGEQSAIPQSAISLHIAKAGEGLFDVAKSMRTTPELILIQNPALDLPLKGGERVLVYRHLKR
ncbi:MAG: hypothetical protein FWD86_00170 [Firmicutes bacterium]|nr:hypothetical protein [Bacillota bacterium]